MSCSQILNDYDGIQHDYTKKQGLVCQQVFLPEYAPAEWSDRVVLWNAVEETEKTKDSRLALRPERERSAASRLQAVHGDEFKAVTLYDSKLDVRDMLGERAQRPGQQRTQKMAPHRQGQQKHRDLDR